MALIKRCDICGRTFEQSKNNAEINAMGFFHRQRDSHLQNSIMIETYDIYQGCEKAIRELILKRKFISL